MANPSVSMPDAMEDEIEERREKGVNRSEYIREAIRARFDAEDAGTWSDGSDEHVRAPEQPAD